MSPKVDWHARYAQQARWTEEVRSHLAQTLKFQQAQRILEAGCGTGVITRWLHEVTTARIFGLDIECSNISRAAKFDGQSLFACADVHFSPFASQSFDITLCHFLLLWVANPLSSLKEMVRVTKKGGYVLALAEPDYGGRIDYPPELSRLGELQRASLKDAGADPLIGRQLACLFRRAGLMNVHTGLLGGNWHQVPSAAEREMEWAVLLSDIGERLPADELETLKALDGRAWQDGCRILFIPTFYAWGQVA